MKSVWQEVYCAEGIVVGLQPSNKFIATFDRKYDAYMNKLL